MSVVDGLGELEALAKGLEEVEGFAKGFEDGFEAGRLSRGSSGRAVVSASVSGEWGVFPFCKLFSFSSLFVTVTTFRSPALDLSTGRAESLLA